MAADDPANETVYDAKLQDAVREFQRGNGLRADGQIGNGTRNALNAAGKPKQAAATPPQPTGNDAKIERILINMERWRWLPEDLGEFYVWDNVPDADAHSRTARSSIPPRSSSASPRGRRRRSPPT